MASRARAKKSWILSRRETPAQTRPKGHNQRVLMQECHVKWGLGTRAVLWSEGARPVTVLRNGKEVLIHSPVRLIGKRA